MRLSATTAGSRCPPPKSNTVEPSPFFVNEPPTMLLFHNPERSGWPSAVRGVVLPSTEQPMHGCLAAAATGLGVRGVFWAIPGHTAMRAATRGRPTKQASAFSTFDEDGFIGSSRLQVRRSTADVWPNA